MIHFNSKDIIGTNIGFFKIESLIRETTLSVRELPVRYNCICFCGKPVVVSDRQLFIGKPKSCGCWQGLPPGRAVKNKYYSHYRSTAKRRSLLFKINQEYFDELVTAPCFYCGREPYRMIRMKDNKYPTALNGLDRLDNAIGYVKGNIVSCCPQCNTMKMDYKAAEFYNNVLDICLNTFQKHPDSKFSKILREKLGSTPPKVPQVDRSEIA
jgi:hypothetical protein